jgi:hypothetical protein
MFYDRHIGSLCKGSVMDQSHPFADKINLIISTKLGSGDEAEKLTRELLAALDKDKLLYYADPGRVNLLNSHGRVLVAILEDPGITQRASTSTSANPTSTNPSGSCSKTASSKNEKKATETTISSIYPAALTTQTSTDSLRLFYHFWLRQNLSIQPRRKRLILNRNDPHLTQVRIIRVPMNRPGDLHLGRNLRNPHIALQAVPR